MDRRKDNAVEAILELLIETGLGDLAGLFARAFEPAMQIERERFLGAGHYQRTPERRGYANGTKPKRIDTPAGTVNVQVPKTAGHEGEPFYPQSLERGRRSVRAVMLAVAEMYIKGVSTRDVEAVMREFGIHCTPHYAGHAGAAAFVRQVDALDVSDTLAISDKLSGLNIPARIVWGAEDQFQKLAYGERLALDLKAPIRRIDGGRHFTPEDHPEIVVQEINALLNEVG
jgi:pimeloyl-ACP methyl ester carboxylesterase